MEKSNSSVPVDDKIDINKQNYSVLCRVCNGYFDMEQGKYDILMDAVSSDRGKLEDIKCKNCRDKKLGVK